MTKTRIETVAASATEAEDEAITEDATAHDVTHPTAAAESELPRCLFLLVFAFSLCPCLAFAAAFCSTLLLS